jgi:hypothetical protein
MTDPFKSRRPAIGASLYPGRPSFLRNPLAGVPEPSAPDPRDLVMGFDNSRFHDPPPAFARMDVTRGGVRTRGFVVNSRTGAYHPWTSELERRMAVLLDSCPAVSTWRAQPQTFQVVVGGVAHRYTPDFEAVTAAGTFLIETKPRSKLASPFVADLHQAFRMQCRARGLSFVAVDEVELGRQPRLSNAELMRRYRGIALTPHTRARLVGMLESGGTRSVRELVEGDQAGRVSFEVILAEAMNGVLWLLDDARPLGESTQVRLASDGTHPPSALTFLSAA